MKIFWEIAILSYILSELVYFEGGLPIYLLVYPPPLQKKKKNKEELYMYPWILVTAMSVFGLLSNFFIGIWLLLVSAVQWSESALYIHLKICEEYEWELIVLSPHVENWLKVAYCSFTVNILFYYYYFFTANILKW